MKRDIPNYKVKKLGPESTEELVRIEEENFGENKYNHGIEETKKRLEDPRFECYGAVHKDEVIGFIFIDKNFKSTKVRIFNCVIPQKYQRKGIGRKLIDKVKEYCEENSKKGIFGIILPDRKYVKRWLEKLGFEKVGRSRYLYRRGREAEIYYRPL